MKAVGTVKVWDPVVRLFHGGLALAVLGSFLTSERDALLPVHVGLGIAVVGLVVLRVAWGLLGPRPARFAAFVRGPREVLGYARAMLRGRPPRHLSHNPLGGAMVMALLVALAGLAATGAVVRAGPEFEGPLTGLLSLRAAKGVKEVHEALSGGLLGLIVVHLAGVLASSLLEGQNLVLGMITGRKRAVGSGDGLEGSPVRPSTGSGRTDLGRTGAEQGPTGAGTGRTLAAVARAAAAVALGAAAAIGLALLLGLPSRAGATPPVAADLLRGYETVARARPGFAGFSAEEGRRLYATPHVQDGQPVSCASCHTDDPRRSGRTPAGKVVEPLAPSANPARLTDPGDVEKWFRRNCKGVLGRECSAEEKGHFVTYLLSR
jgi:cytochrome b